MLTIGPKLTLFTKLILHFSGPAHDAAAAADSVAGGGRDDGMVGRRLAGWLAFGAMVATWLYPDF